MNPKELKKDIEKTIQESKEGLYQWQGDWHWYISLHIDNVGKVRVCGEYHCYSDDPYGSNEVYGFETLDEVIEWANGFKDWRFTE